MQLSSDVERAVVAAAKLRAEASAELRAAASNHDFAQKKKVRTQDLFQKNFVSEQVKDQAATEAEVAEMRLKQAREQTRQAQQDLALAQAQLAQRLIKSPLSGVIVERYLSEGERVEDRPVIKVATIDPLRVEVIVPATHFNRIKAGMVGSVRPEMADVELRSAKVVVVDKVIDAASNSFRVRLELPNPDHALPPGLRCKVEFDGMTAPQDNAAVKPQDSTPVKPRDAAAVKRQDNAAVKPQDKAARKPQRPSVAAAPPR